jgi:hypothetical protein
MRASVIALTLSVVGVACESDVPSDSPSMPSMPSATTSVQPSTATTTATVANPSNRAPEVRLTGDDGCHPVRRGDVVTSCSVSLRAEASDPDGDALHYRWSGCAGGTDADATCSIDRLGVLTATVEVTDGRGASAKASKNVEGTNRAPTPGSFFCFYRPSQNPGAPDCGHAGCEPPIPTNGIGFCIDGSFSGRDVEGDGMGCGPISATGPCTVLGIYECGGVADAFSFEFRTGDQAGECVLGITVSDDWGATGSTEARVSVQ